MAQERFYLLDYGLVEGEATVRFAVRDMVLGKAVSLKYHTLPGVAEPDQTAVTHHTGMDGVICCRVLGTMSCMEAAVGDPAAALTALRTGREEAFTYLAGFL